MDYHDSFTFPEDPSIEDDPEFCIVVYPEYAALHYRREELGLSQQEAADRSGITLRQYQRFESGERSMASASLRIGLSICRTLDLDPYRFIAPPTSS